MNLTLRQVWVSVRLLLVMTVLLGVIYPVAIFAVGRIVAGTSDGSYVTDSAGSISPVEPLPGGAGIDSHVSPTGSKTSRPEHRGATCAPGKGLPMESIRRLVARDSAHGTL